MLVPGGQRLADESTVPAARRLAFRPERAALAQLGKPPSAQRQQDAAARPVPAATAGKTQERAIRPIMLRLRCPSGGQLLIVDSGALPLPTRKIR